MIARRLKNSGRMKELVDAAYTRFINAPKEGKKVAWLIGPVPFTPLRAMGIPYIHSENYGARLASRRVSFPFFAEAEKWGLSKNACSYMRGTLGMMLTALGKDVKMPPECEPYRLPLPDMVIIQNYCVSALNIGEVIYKELKVPTFVIDMPHHYLAEKDYPIENYLPYEMKIMREFITFLEEQMGKRMDYDQFSEVLRLLKEQVIVRNSVLDSAKHVPAPLTIFDAWISMGASTMASATQEAIDYFTGLKKEIDQRIADGVSSVPNERFRLLWDHMAVWPKVGYLSELFASKRAAVVWNLYSRSVGGWDPQWIDPSKPVETIALDILKHSSSIHWTTRVGHFVDAIKEFSIDALVGHSPTTCRKNSVAQPVYFEETQRRTGVPAFRFDADHADGSFYAPEQVEMRFEAFIETLDARKRALGI